METAAMRRRSVPPALDADALEPRSSYNATGLYPRASNLDGLTAASFYIPTLPNLERTQSPSFQAWGGHIPSDNSPPPTDGSAASDAHLYFLMLKARHVADKERLIFWFNGGPGCSSFDGSMMETGAWKMTVRDDGTVGIKETPHGWHEYANVVFVDQPVGTGFSYASTNAYMHELDEAANQVVTFFENFFKIFPELKGVDTYIAGESFAGQYIPYIADAVLKQPSPPINLKGLLIGNGWIDPVNQYPGYVDFARDRGLVKSGSDAEKHLQSMLDACETSIKDNMMKSEDGVARSPVYVDMCEQLMGAVTSPYTQTVNGKKVCMNIYDIRLVDNFPECGMGWPPEVNDVKTYLRDKDVVKDLHATGKSTAWVECNHKVGQQLRVHNTPASIYLFSSLLEKLEIILFVGDQDLICNIAGQERMIRNLEWNGATGFQNASVLPYTVNGKDAGEWTSARNLTLVKLAGASHMAPYDVPEVTLDMLLRFTGVDVREGAGGAGRLPSSVGDDSRSVIGDTVDAGKSEGKPSSPLFDPEAYYNAGTAALIFVIILAAVGIVLFCRRWRRKRAERFGSLRLSRRNVANEAELGDDEERAPLGATSHELGDLERGDSIRAKGKGRATVHFTPEEGDTVFELGSDDQDAPDRRGSSRRE